ncbi:Protein PHYTOCHROME KINASE SUBSTRATE [Parasponia andersonii]|uniref:Protein PHYTOCHROME KINASE SUBSTRATE n=1 Tax=Parasponia andersonii TaxID=3476 RepID=A0A2P5C8F2_PARAD|nr:Protein PHYTOCHROME KINASE SUBSTRATE [Parasponia andersonii]
MDVEGDNLRDASFSYLREESLLQKSRNNKKSSDQEGEISVFGAERYFNMLLEDDKNGNPNIVDRRSSSIKKENQQLDHHHHHHHHHNLGSERPRLAPATPSASSEMSWTSRSTAFLLRNSSPHHNKSNNNNKNKNEKKKVKSYYSRNIFATLGCTGSCSDDKAVCVDDPQKLREPKSDHALDHDHHNHRHDLTYERSSKRSEEQFAFPILSSTTTTTTTTTTAYKDYNKRVDPDGGEDPGRVSLEVFGSKTTASRGGDHHDDVATNLERKLSVLTWDAIPVKPGHNIINKQLSSMYTSTDDNNNLDSDASSDLFEIENITAAAAASRSPEPPSVLLVKASTQLLASNDNNVARRHMTPNVSSQYYSSYEPSEASIEWSVVTASAAADQMSSAVSEYYDEKKFMRIEIPYY